MTTIRMDLCTISSSFTELKCAFSFRCLNSVWTMCHFIMCVFVDTLDCLLHFNKGENWISF